MRAFERNREGRTVKTDGGRRTETEPATEDDDDEAAHDEDGTRRMRDVDHTSPVDGPNRTFSRGYEDDDRE